MRHGINRDFLWHHERTMFMITRLTYDMSRTILVSQTLHIYISLCVKYRQFLSSASWRLRRWAIHNTLQFAKHDLWSVECHCLDWPDLIHINCRTLPIRHHQGPTKGSEKDSIILLPVDETLGTPRTREYLATLATDFKIVLLQLCMYIFARVRGVAGSGQTDLNLSDSLADFLRVGRRIATKRRMTEAYGPSIYCTWALFGPHPLTPAATPYV